MSNALRACRRCRNLPHPALQKRLTILPIAQIRLRINVAERARADKLAAPLPGTISTRKSVMSRVTISSAAVMLVTWRTGKRFRMEPAPDHAAGLSSHGDVPGLPWRCLHPSDAGIHATLKQCRKRDAHSQTNNFALANVENSWTRRAAGRRLIVKL